MTLLEVVSGTELETPVWRSSGQTCRATAGRDADGSVKRAVSGNDIAVGAFYRRLRVRMDKTRTHTTVPTLRL